MIHGRLMGKRILIEDVADASTLRNKGFVGKNIGQKLSLDLVTSLDLIKRKKIEVSKGTRSISTELIEASLSIEEKKTAIAFHFLKMKGKKPVIRDRMLTSVGTRVLVFQNGEHIDFTSIKGKSSLLAVVDEEGNCLLYSIRKITIGRKLRRNGKNSPSKPYNLRELLDKKGVRVASGLKFGSEFRLYDGNSSHAKYLMMKGNGPLVMDLVARVRIAQSVRKTFVQAAYDEKRKGFNFFEIAWLRL